MLKSVIAQSEIDITVMSGLETFSGESLFSEKDMAVLLRVAKPASKQTKRLLEQRPLWGSEKTKHHISTP